MIQVENVVGRLIEVRTTSPFTIEEIAAFGASLMRILSQLKGRIVACTDLRGAHLASPEQSETFISLFRRDNPLVERSAILLADDQAMLGLQVERLVREGGNSARRTFRDLGSLYAHLDGVLNSEERARLRVFLTKDDARPSTR